MIDLGDDPLVGAALAEVLKAYPKLERPRMIHETVRRLISAMVNDVLGESGKRAEGVQAGVGRGGPRRCAMPVVAFSAQMKEKNRVLQAFLSQRMYRHERVLAIMARAQRVIRDLFEAYMNDPELAAARTGARIPSPTTAAASRARSAISSPA